MGCCNGPGIGKGVSLDFGLMDVPLNPMAMPAMRGRYDSAVGPALPAYLKDGVKDPAQLYQGLGLLSGQMKAPGGMSPSYGMDASRNALIDPSYAAQIDNIVKPGWGRALEAKACRTYFDIN